MDNQKVRDIQDQNRSARESIALLTMRPHNHDHNRNRTCRCGLIAVVIGCDNCTWNPAA